MGNLVTVDASKIIVGPARMMIAPLGTAIPDVTADPPTWDTAWKELGSTEDGLQWAHNVAVKDFNVDERSAPVGTVQNTDTVTLAAKLAEATLDNLAYAIATAKKSTVAAATGTPGTTTLKAGGAANLTFYMIGFEGLTPPRALVTKPWRVFCGYKAIASSNVQLAFKRLDKTIIPVQFKLYSDTTKAGDEDLYFMTDKTAEPL